MRILITSLKSWMGWLVLGEVTTVIYIAGIAGVANATGVAFVLFPELAALAYDVFTRPQGTWANAHVMLVVTPVLAAIPGVLIEQNMSYGFSSVLLSIAASLLIIKILRSPIAPAISAGLLPLVLKEGSWWYPATILFGTALLAGTLLLYQRVFYRSGDDAPDWIGFAESDVIEQVPKQYAWLPFFAIFLLASILLVKLTGLRFILFPPLVVIGFEMFAHSERCPWADKPIRLVVVCMLAAWAGLTANMVLGNGPFAAMLAVGSAIGVCRMFSLYIPPAAAISLLPFVTSHQDFRFPVAVGGGTFLLAVSFISYRFFCNTRGKGTLPLA